MKKDNNDQPKFILFDAKGQVLGRLAVDIAKVLSGKGEVDFQPNIGGSSWAIVVNSDKVRLTGEKDKKKVYYRHSGFPGGIKQKTFEEAMTADSTWVIKNAVKGMMPKNKLSGEALKRLRVFKDENHPYKDKIVSK